MPNVHASNDKTTMGPKTHLPWPGEAGEMTVLIGKELSGCPGHGETLMAEYAGPVAVTQDPYNDPKQVEKATGCPAHLIAF